jgi:ferredoxin
MDSPFDVLQVDPGADDEEIERAFRRRVKETHPDLGGSASAFQEVYTAYAEIRAGEGAADDGVPATDDDEPGDDVPRPEDTHVEFLNYEVLDDHGWRLDDPDLFEKAASAELDETDYGEFAVHPRDTLLEGAENGGHAWPYACRGGACANCAVAVLDGELTQPVDHILPPAMSDRGIRLSCNGRPLTERLTVVYNVKYLPDLDELRLPPYPFEAAYRSR